MPAPTFNLAAIGAGLPVAAAEAELRAAATAGGFVVTAPPGTGKSTFVPPLLACIVAERLHGPDPASLESATAAQRADTARRADTAPSPGLVLLSQPRRVAVRAVASRITTLAGGVPGGAVGFTVRGDRKVSRETRIEALTPGVLLRRLLQDPELPGVAAVILDEVHERSVEGDLLLGMLAEVRALRDDLLVVAMSATLDAERTAALLGAGAGASDPAAASPGSAPIVAIPSALHPLRIDYAPFAGQRITSRGVQRDYLAHLADVTLEALGRGAGNDGDSAAGDGQCDALVFVPGAREVDETVRLLRERGATDAGFEVLPLHGRISSREQDRAVRGRGPAEATRIVVTTALAESSLTVPGVRLVVDSGLAREVRRDQGRDMTGLVTVSTSRASAEQRAGRAARQGPGRAIRVYSETDFARMPLAAPPEIAAADLTDAALTLAVWGTPRGAGIALPSQPPPQAMQEAERTLQELELVDDAGRPTPLGARVALLPVGARAARALLAGAQELGDAALAAEIVAVVSDDFREQGASLPALLRELRTGLAAGAERWRREAKRLTAIAAADLTGAAANGPRIPDPTQHADAPGIVLALARPAWIARRAGAHSRSYLLASGTRAALPEGSALISHEWIVVHAVQRAAGRAADGTGAVIRLAAPLTEAAALRLGDALVRTERAATIADGRVRVREERRLGAILLAATPAAARPEDAAAAFASHLQRVGLAALDWTAAATNLRWRLALLHRELGAPWPAVGDATLLATLSDWLGPDLAKLTPGASLHSLDVAAALRRLLPWPAAVRFDELAPERLAVPSGAAVRIDYQAMGDGPRTGAASDGPDGDAAASADEGGAQRSTVVSQDPAATPSPIVAVKLQEVFGLAETPRIADGRVPLLFHLLSPARRPLAVTADLSSFWNGPYQDVRREMRGKYPKHPWPEDPWTAQATARTKRRM